MNKIFSCCLLLIFTTPLFSQQLDTLPTQSTLTATDYLQKSRHQKTTGWILTAAGTAGLLITMTIDANQATEGALTYFFTLGSVEPEYKSYTVPYVLSAAVLGTGIGFFIAAKQNKKRAAALSARVYLKMESAPVPQQGQISKLPYPAIVFRLPL